VSQETLGTAAAIGTFVVIAATAIAAVVQLRHLRAANQVAAVRILLEEYEGAELRDAFHFVRAELAGRLEDPVFREELRSGVTDRLTHPEVTICNFFDKWGAHYREGAIDRRAFMRQMAGVTVSFWKRLEPAIALMTYPEGVNTAFEAFEYLSVEARGWIARHPQGDYPRGKPRITLVDPWLQIDRDAVAGVAREAQSRSSIGGSGERKDREIWRSAPSGPFLVT